MPVAPRYSTAGALVLLPTLVALDISDCRLREFGNAVREQIAEARKVLGEERGQIKWLCPEGGVMTGLNIQAISSVVIS